MFRFETNNLYNFFYWLANFKDGVDSAEVVRAKLLQVEKVLDQKPQQALTRTIHLQRVGEFAVNDRQPLFDAVGNEVFGANNFNEVTDLPHQHFHRKILRLNGIQRIARVV